MQKLEDFTACREMFSCNQFHFWKKTRDIAIHVHCPKISPDHKSFMLEKKLFFFQTKQMPFLFTARLYQTPTRSPSAPCTWGSYRNSCPGARVTTCLDTIVRTLYTTGNCYVSPFIRDCDRSFTNISCQCVFCGM